MQRVVQVLSDATVKGFKGSDDEDSGVEDEKSWIFTKEYTKAVGLIMGLLGVGGGGSATGHLQYVDEANENYEGGFSEKAEDDPFLTLWELLVVKGKARLAEKR